MRDLNVVEVFEGLRSFAQGESEIDMESQAESHDMGVMFVELQRRSILGKGV